MKLTSAELAFVIIFSLAMVIVPAFYFESDYEPLEIAEKSFGDEQCAETDTSISATVTSVTTVQSVLMSESVTAVSQTETVFYPININTADKETLMRIKGIGEVYAQRIIDYREQYGTFTSVDELVNIKGIGEKTLEKIREYVCVE